MGDDLLPNGLSMFASSLFQVDISEIIADEGDEPNAVVDFLDAEFLTCQHVADVDLLSVHADAAAIGDHVRARRVGGTAFLRFFSYTTFKGTTSMPPSAASPRCASTP